MKSKKAALSSPKPNQPPQTSSRSYFQITVMAAFLTILLIPSVGLYRYGFTYDPQDAPEAEARLAPLTQETLEDGSYARSFKQYFAQRFFLRRQLIRLISHVGLRFGVPVTHDVIIGSDGWLFFGDDAERRCLARRTRYTDAELREWREYLEGVRSDLDARGIKFLFFVAPDKHSLYREHVPDHAQGSGHGPSRMDQILDHLRSRSTVPVADLRDPLKAAKAQFQIYSKWDTHWNAQGAFVAYSQVSEWIGRAFGTPANANPGDYAIRRTGRPGDLGRILGVADYLVEEVPVFEPKAPTGCDLSEYNEGQAEGASFMTRCPVTGSPRKILVFRDSFANALVPFLAREAAEVKFVWRILPDLAMIDRDKPELVIFEIVERRLMRPPGWLKR